MTYPVLGIPNATDVPSQSQAQIQTNFNSIIGWATTDHVGYGTTNAGQHNQVTFPTAISPTPSPATTVGVLYTALDAGSASQLFFANKNGTVQLSGTGSGDQISGSISGPGGGSFTVFTLPFGFRIFTGNVGSVSGSRNMTLIGALFGSTIYSAVCSPYGASAMGSSITPNASFSTFNIQSSNAAPLYFIVITN